MYTLAVPSKGLEKGQFGWDLRQHHQPKEDVTNNIYGVMYWKGHQVVTQSLLDLFRDLYSSQSKKICA